MHPGRHEERLDEEVVSVRLELEEGFRLGERHRLGGWRREKEEGHGSDLSKGRPRSFDGSTEVFRWVDPEAVRGVDRGRSRHRPRSFNSLTKPREPAKGSRD